MLAVRLICVGKLGEKFWKTACEEYVKRLSAYCRLEIVEVSEQRLSDCPAEGQVRQALAREAAAVRAKIPAGAAVIALCVEGKQISSEALAETLGALTVSGVSRLALLIGGSFGLDETLKKEARLRLSLSSMTFPHHLARVMVLEQLYRAMNLQAGGKYHK